MDADLYDVAIIGGGPAGSTAATLLAKAGRRVVVFEREKFPRFHIGESLLPFSVQTFDRLGVRGKLDHAFMPKFGGEITPGCGTKGVKFYFKDGFRSQRDRVEFADEHVSLFWRDARRRVPEIMGHDSACPSSDEGEIRARYLVDCSGRQT